MIMERDKLLSMSKEQIKESFLNKRVRIVMNDDKEEEFIVANLRVTCLTNIESCTIVGFISQLEKSYLFTSFKEIDVLSS